MNFFPENPEPEKKIENFYLDDDEEDKTKITNFHLKNSALTVETDGWYLDEKINILAFMDSSLKKAIQTMRDGVLFYLNVGQKFIPHEDVRAFADEIKLNALLDVSAVSFRTKLKGRMWGLNIDSTSLDNNEIILIINALREANATYKSLPDTFPNFANNRGLTVLKITNITVDNDVVNVAIAVAYYVREANASLTDLDMRNNRMIDGVGAKAIADAIRDANDNLSPKQFISERNRGGVKKLNISFNGIGADGARAFSETLRGTNCSLTEFNMSKNNIRDIGAQAIAEALRGRNSSLTTLDISTNDIGFGGVRAIADALLHNVTLKELVLSYNPIGSEGAIALANVLREANSSVHTTRLGRQSGLTKLTLIRCQIGQNGVLALADSLKTNASLTSLNVSSNEISNEGAQSFVEALETNSTLTELNLDYNRIRKATILKEISNKLEKNKKTKQQIMSFVKGAELQSIQSDIINPNITQQVFNKTDAFKFLQDRIKMNLMKPTPPPSKKPKKN